MSWACIFFRRKSFTVSVIYATLLLKENTHAHTEQGSQVARAAILLLNSLPIKMFWLQISLLCLVFRLFFTYLQTRSSAQRKGPKMVSFISVSGKVPVLAIWTVLLGPAISTQNRMTGSRRPLVTLESEKYCGELPEEHLGLCLGPLCCCDWGTERFQ